MKPTNLAAGSGSRTVRATVTHPKGSEIITGLQRATVVHRDGCQVLRFAREPNGILQERIYRGPDWEITITPEPDTLTYAGIASRWPGRISRLEAGGADDPNELAIVDSGEVRVTFGGLNVNNFAQMWAAFEQRMCRGR